MAGAMERSSCRVEGQDDKYALINLLIRHGVDYDRKPWPPEFPEFQKAENVENMLQGMQTAVALSTGRAVGFVLDADRPLVDRWQAVRDRLRAVHVAAPDRPPPDGFVGECPTYRSRVGVWLMPDNQHDGKLETFLQTLIGEKDALIDHATSATNAAKELGAEFAERDQIKAVMHTWLAWQEEPGKPYGTAIRARYFRGESAAAREFVAWFKKLFSIA